MSTIPRPPISLVEEVREMMQLALMIYGTTDLRQVARKQRDREYHQNQQKKQPLKQISTWLPDVPAPLRNDDEVIPLRQELLDHILSVPFSLTVLEQILGKNMPELQKIDSCLVETFLAAMPNIRAQLKYGGNHSHFDCIQSKQDFKNDCDDGSGLLLFDVDADDGSQGQLQDTLSHEVESSAVNRSGHVSSDDAGISSGESEGTCECRDRWPPGVIVTAFVDDQSEDELVYALGYNSYRKRITICFRGSVTINDWLIDADVRMVPFPNPVESDGRQYEKTSFVRIHKGFHGTFLLDDAILPIKILGCCILNALSTSNKQSAPIFKLICLCPWCRLPLWECLRAKKP